MKTPTNPIDQEKLAERESEALTSESDEASQAVQNLDEVAEEALIAEKAAGTDQAEPAELAAIKTNNDSANEANGINPETVAVAEADEAIIEKKKGRKPAAKKVAEPSTKKPTKTDGRSKSYLAVRAHVEPGKLYGLEEAIELVKKMSTVKFDSAIELHLRLTQKKAKGSTESSRGILHLPHGTGKEKKIIVLNEAKIEEIAKTKKIDFDVALASPELMPKVARIAKILGPKGKMPDPKAGTVTSDPKKTIEEINSGKVEYRIDATNNIHQLVGRVSWDNAKLVENANAVFSSLPKARIAAAYLTGTMTPSVAIDIGFLK